MEYCLKYIILGRTITYFYYYQLLIHRLSGPLILDSLSNTQHKYKSGEDYYSLSMKFLKWISVNLEKMFFHLHKVGERMLILGIITVGFT